MLWELRYRARMVDDVLIETVDGATEDQARVVAEDYLRRLSHPSVTFVRIRPIIVWSDRQMKQAAEKEAPAAAPPATKGKAKGDKPEGDGGTGA